MHISLKQLFAPVPPEGSNLFECEKQPLILPKTSFSYNWNNKLLGKCFTTFRIANNQKYVVGGVHEIILELNKKPPLLLGTAQIVTKHTLLLSDVTDFMACIDTGYRLAGFQNVIKSMYKGKNFDHQKFDFICFNYQSFTDDWRTLKPTLFKTENDDNV
jgi:hypothetical protein